MSRVPRIRFKGFEEDWEQRKLGEIAERIIRKNEKLESTLPLTISAQYGLIDQNEFFDKRIASKDVRGYYLIKKGEFAYNKSTSVDAPLGAIKRLDKYKNGVLSTLYILFKIIDDTSTSSDYLVTYYATDLWHRGIQSIAEEGARNHGLLNIAPNDFFETMLSIPLNISEQKKVGDFFISLNHLITLHQRKLEKFKIIKKSMLENLFPQNGEKTPKIRFSGFTKDWEQRKLGEMVEFYNGDRSSRYPNDSDMVFDGIPFINAGDLVLGRVKLDTTNKITEEKYNQLSGAKIQCGDIIYCLRGTLGKNAFVDNFDIGTIASSLVDIRPQKIVGKYLFQVLNSDIEYSQRILNDEGAAQPNLSAKNLYLFDIPIPRDAEQIKIAEYLELLDHLITLHQSKLDKLQKIKKSMLESMFV
ncbi:restriction endonuclease subunit S [Lachnoanaerobaculum umeaense]|uniref:Restriction endonuclease subunit S n=1 Tax=Lachnoanaerobaculum umeaense TaxID=617123 RepID=A0A385Q0D4_9FIRM|nr:restriction endonuclease subunit S [Lachnoanaerobaculum umeaense]AYA99636.1 restriction endonuclease subunit S [Lachnoanaerobaculum umeaense]PZW98655.1 type I restriction enzyme S subunit [Lachnoanaerobaculum umeaense]